MKFQNLEAFEKHLEGAFPDHPSSCYLALASSLYEQKWIASKVTSRFKGADVVTLNEDSVETLIAELATTSLLASQKVIVFEGIEKIKKGGLDPLILILKNLAPSTYLIMTGSSAKSHSNFLKEMMTEVVLLDLSAEKPWDRKTRLERSVLQYFKTHLKTIDRDALSLLLSPNELDLSHLLQEAEKLICYAHPSDRITIQDVQVISNIGEDQKGWQYTEEIVWGNAGPVSVQDSSEFFALLGQLRYHLQIGLQVALIVENPLLDVPSSVAKLRPKSLDKYKGLARVYTSHYFREGLTKLCQMEITSKSSSISPKILWDGLLAKLTQMKQLAKQ